MTAADRLRDALTVGKKTRGRRVPVYRPDGSLDHNAVEHIEVTAGDVAEVCALAKDPTDSIVQAQSNCSRLPKDLKVVLYADHVFHLLDQVPA